MTMSLSREEVLAFVDAHAHTRPYLSYTSSYMRHQIGYGGSRFSDWAGGRLVSFIRKSSLGKKLDAVTQRNFFPNLGKT